MDIKCQKSIGYGSFVLSATHEAVIIPSNKDVPVRLACLHRFYMGFSDIKLLRMLLMLCPAAVVGVALCPDNLRCPFRLIKEPQGNSGD